MKISDRDSLGALRFIHQFKSTFCFGKVYFILYQSKRLEGALDRKRAIKYIKQLYGHQA